MFKKLALAVWCCLSLILGASSSSSDTAHSHSTVKARVLFSSLYGTTGLVAGGDYYLTDEGFGKLCETFGDRSANVELLLEGTIDDLASIMPVYFGKIKRLKSLTLQLEKSTSANLTQEDHVVTIINSLHPVAMDHLIFQIPMDRARMNAFTQLIKKGDIKKTTLSGYWKNSESIFPMSPIDMGYWSRHHFLKMAREKGVDHNVRLGWFFSKESTVHPTYAMVLDVFIPIFLLVVIAKSLGL